MRFWDHENNAAPETIKDNSTKPVNLRCPNCGYRWSPTPVNFFRNTKKCPACELRHAVQPGFTDLFTLVPDLKKYYLPELNPDIDVSRIGISSKKKLHWKCPDCCREWEDPVFFRVARKNGAYYAKQCRFCYLQDPNRYEPVSNCPQLMEFWDTENNEANPALIASHSAQDVHWKCNKCGYRWASSPRDRIRALEGCPCCGAGKAIKPGFNDALTLHPELKSIYDPALNDGNNLSETASSSRKQFKWKCPDCGYTWSATIKNTIISSYHCPNCLNRRAIPGVNSLTDKRPDIAQLWSSSNNDKSPSEVLLNSYYWAKWICPDCGGEYSAYVVDMVSGKTRCPYCTEARALPGFNSLADKHPDLAIIWSHSNTKSPSELLPSSYYPAKWICPDCGGEYSAHVSDMVSGEVRCPYCTGTRILPGFNSLKALHPDLMDEWEFINNSFICDPDTISESCRVPVWWRCQRDKNHSYMMTPSERLTYQNRGRESCPYCKGYRRNKNFYL